MIIIGQYLPSGQPDMKFSSGDRGLGGTQVSQWVTHELISTSVGSLVHFFTFIRTCLHTYVNTITLADTKTWQWDKIRIRKGLSAAVCVPGRGGSCAWGGHCVSATKGIEEKGIYKVTWLSSLIPRQKASGGGGTRVFSFGTRTPLGSFWATYSRRIVVWRRCKVAEKFEAQLRRLFTGVVQNTRWL